MSLPYPATTTRFNLHRGLAMSVADIWKGRTKKVVQITTDTVTVIGEFHKKDGVPNQDTSFSLMLPGKRLATPKGPRALVTADGIFAIGVFDGHGDDGHVASKMASEVAQQTLSRLFSSDYTQGRIEHYLKLTFEVMSNTLAEHPCSEDSGTTATIAIVYDSEVVIAHCGDSCGLFMSCENAGARARSRYVTQMHRPALEPEAERIKSAGGLLIDGYVVDKETKKKGIAVTRTIGDTDMQKNGCISVPEVMSLALEPTDIAITLATDGLWDCDGLTVRDVLTDVKTGDGDPVEINRLLLGHTLPAGPSDDCTVVTMVLS